MTEPARAPRRLKLVITEGISGPPVDALAAYADIVRCDHDPSELRRVAHDADVMLVRTMTRVDRELVENCPNLRAVGRYGVGLDNFDLDACAERGIEVYNSPGQNAIAVAELTIMLILLLARGRALDAEVYGSWERDGATGIEMHSRTLGVIGLGNIGQRVAIRAQALGMRVLANDPYIPDYAWGSVTPAPLDDLLSESDVVSMHVPATTETRGMVDARFLSTMKPGAWFINTARGSLVDEAVLVTALDSGQLGGAALDVRTVEPATTPDPLQGRSDVLLTPHIAGFTHTSLERVLDMVCAKLAAKMQQLSAET